MYLAIVAAFYCQVLNFFDCYYALLKIVHSSFRSQGLRCDAEHCSITEVHIL